MVYISSILICIRCRTYHCRWLSCVERGLHIEDLVTGSLISDTPSVGLKHNTLGSVLTRWVVKLKLVVLVHFVCIEQDMWGIAPIWSSRGQCIISHLVWSGSSWWESVHQSFATLTYLVGPVTTVHKPCILGSDTGCMTQVIYNWTPYYIDW